MEKKENIILQTNPEDISSFANFQEFQQTHIFINNKINFEKQE